MKKQLSLLLMFTLMFLGSACSDDDEKVPVYEFLIEEELLTLTPPALGEMLLYTCYFITKQYSY